MKRKVVRLMVAAIASSLAITIPFLASFTLLSEAPAEDILVFGRMFLLPTVLVTFIIACAIVIPLHVYLQSKNIVGVVWYLGTGYLIGATFLLIFSTEGSAVGLDKVRAATTFGLVGVIPAFVFWLVGARPIVA